ncbi:MAG TPA: zf-HC2 domain-containing protein [Chloroflexota bacterium]
MRGCDPEALSRYLDGDLGFTARQELNRHLRECRLCSNELAELRNIDNVLRTFGAKRTPLTGAADARITHAVQKRRQHGRFSSFLALSRMMPAAVGSSIAAVLVVLSVNMHQVYPAHSSADAAWARQQSSIKRQAAPLLKARQSAAILSGQVKSTATVQPRHRLFLNVN